MNWPEAFRKAAAVQEAKIKEAYTLLQEANELDPFNTEVLLRMAFHLETKDPSAARKIVLGLLILVIKCCTYSLSASIPYTSSFRVVRTTATMARMPAELIDSL